MSVEVYASIFRATCVIANSSCMKLIHASKADRKAALGDVILSRGGTGPYSIMSKTRLGELRMLSSNHSSVISQYEIATVAGTKCAPMNLRSIIIRKSQKALSSLHHLIVLL
jgi:hypothetical protein